MNDPYSRRQILALCLALGAAGGTANAASAERTLKDIHKRIGGRLGVHVLDSQSGKRFGIDDDSRYAMASTFKLPLAAALMWQVDRAAFGPDRPLAIDRKDLLPNSPAVEAKLNAGATAMTIRELCAAVITLSDNAAANVLLTAIGGPPALTTFFRDSVGDKVTRFDRTELELNTNVAGDPRDTTTPRAMVDSMLRLFTQDVLSLASRALLIDWMTQSRTGLDRVRAGFPRGWQAGDKTGTGANNAVNDLVVVYPPNRRPIFIAVYTSESTQTREQIVAAHADVGRLVAETKWP
ncbi:MAG TPA: class A beta-lactamase [Steroidobacteraceae bacterium]|nr:class A beta-lactamase [Steroidobacteraceae bacterium]